jgi:cytochrome c biogenesis protein CcdA
MFSKKFYVLLFCVAALVALMVVFKLNFQSVGNWSTRTGWFLPLVTIAALIDSINPCAFSVLLLTIGFLFSLGRARQSILQIGLTYIFGIFTVYLAIGLGILKTLQLFNMPHFAAKVGAALIIAFGGISIVNELVPQFPIKLKIPTVSHRKIAELMEKASVPAAFVLGFTVGLFEFPCTGGPYLAVLGLLHDSSTYWLGFWYLTFYNLIFVLPLIVILLLASEQSLMEKVQAWKKSHTSSMRLYGGLAAIAVGVLILFL